MENSAPTAVEDDEISLLDLLQTIVDNLRLLIIGGGQLSRYLAVMAVMYKTIIHVNLSLLNTPILKIYRIWMPVNKVYLSCYLNFDTVLNAVKLVLIFRK